MTFMKANNSKLITIIVIILLAIVLVLKFKKNTHRAEIPANTSVSNNATQQNNLAQNTGEAFRQHRFKFSKHALCRMDCRKITEEEIKEVVQHGAINQHKSDLNANECPRYALEEKVDNKRLRIIVGDCNDEAVIITVIDLGNEFDCHCPGDEHKH